MRTTQATRPHRATFMLLMALLLGTSLPVMAQAIFPPGAGAPRGPATTWDVGNCTALVAVLAGAMQVGAAGAVCEAGGAAAAATENLLIAQLARLGITVTANQLKGAGIIGAGGLGTSCPTTVSSIFSKLAETASPATNPIAAAARSCLAVGGDYLGALVDCTSAVYACVTDPISHPNPGDLAGVAMGRQCRANSGTWNPFGSWRIQCESCCMEAYSSGKLPLDEVPMCKAVCK